MAWLFILSDLAAAKWVLEERRMGFKPRVRRANYISVGDRFALYTTTRIFGSYRPSQIVGVGEIASEVVWEEFSIGGTLVSHTCGLTFEVEAPLGEGMDFSPLVGELGFITNKRKWQFHVYQSAVKVPEDDFELIRERFYEVLSDGRESD